MKFPSSVKEFFNSKAYVIGFILALGIGFLLGVGDLIKDFRKDMEDYPAVKHANSYEGEIVELRAAGGGIFIDLNGGEKIMLESARNYDYNPMFLFQFLRKGDVIHKPAQSDSLLVHRNGKVYYFIQGKTLGR